MFYFIFFIDKYFFYKYALNNKKEVKNSFLDELFNFTTYAQLYEDLILFCVFYDVKSEDGFYIDIGANDPTQNSVTKAFYLRGWHGINMEPWPLKFELLSKERTRDINLQMGAGKEEGNFTFYEKGDLSTLKTDLKRMGSTEMTITVNTVSNICKKYVPKGTIIQFCKIDVEGGEQDVLLGYDFENYRPKVFCIEATKPSTKIPTHDQWEYILTNHSYSFVFQHDVNRFYVDDKIEGLRERFNKVKKIIKFYKYLNRY